jgi:hypothetical protein
VADLQTADFAIVNAADVLEHFRHRLLQLEVGGTASRLGFSRPTLPDLHHNRQRVQDDFATTNTDEFKMSQA